jgi:hypothetical protein
MRAVLRAARPEDFNYCADLYFDEMERTLDVPTRERAAAAAGFRGRWKVTEVRIITLDGVDIGWLQTRTKDDSLFLVQILRCSRLSETRHRLGGHEVPD